MDMKAALVDLIIVIIGVMIGMYLFGFVQAKLPSSS